MRTMLAPLLLLAACNTCLAQDRLVVADGGRSDYVIVLPDAATDVEKTAGRELREHLALATGVTLAVVAESDAPSDAPRLLVGRCRRSLDVLKAADVDLEKMPPDAIVIKTVENDVLLAGQGVRGTLYAVFTFLEDTVGCRWWTSTERTVPKRPRLEVPPLDIVFAPKLRFRSAFYRDAFDGVYSARHKLNGHHARCTAGYGGHHKFVGFVHTFYGLIPPGKYFAEHPEWFSEIDGRRKHEHAQLCLTNDAMRAELVKNALGWLRADPSAGLISISQNDWHGQCQCEKCRAVEAEEGGPTGPLLRFVNAVAEQIEKEFPDVMVETLAYQYTRVPPLKTRPRDNVVIRLCSIECSFVQTLADGPQNEKFRADIEGWSRIAPRLFVWDYVTNFSSYILPHPNMRVLGPNLRFFTDNNVIGMFEQGDAHSSIGDFVRMRAWVISHLLWDPTRDEDALIDEFLAGYYGPAAPHLREYLDCIHDAGTNSGVYLRCFMNDTSLWLSLDDANRATELYARATDAVKDDPVLARRVRRERLPLDHVWLNRYYALKRMARAEKKPFRGPADPAAACDEFIALAKEHAVGRHREWNDFSEYEEPLRRRFRPAGPPPAACKDLPEDDWIDIQDNQFRMSKAGQWSEMVDDAAASDGRAIRMPGDHFEWATSYPIPGDLAYGNPWRCFAEVRCEATATDGVAMTMGIYDSKERKSTSHRRLTVEQMPGAKYHVVDLGTHALRGGMYFWFAPPKRPGEVTAVLVDRIYLIREEGAEP